MYDLIGLQWKNTASQTITVANLMNNVSFWVGYRMEHKKPKKGFIPSKKWQGIVSLPLPVQNP
jgi:hypothetical protein